MDQENLRHDQNMALSSSPLRTMLRRYFKESFHLLHLVLFKPLTLAEETDQLSRKERLLIPLKILPVSLALALGMLEVHATVVRHTSDWFAILVTTLTIVLFAGLLVGQAVGLLVVLITGPNSGLALRLSSGLSSGLSIGLALGLVLTLAREGDVLDSGLPVTVMVVAVIGQVVGLLIGPNSGRVLALSGGLLFMLLVVLAPESSVLDSGLTVVLVVGGIIGLVLGGVSSQIRRLESKLEGKFPVEVFIGVFVGTILGGWSLGLNSEDGRLDYTNFFLFWYPIVVLLLSLRLFYWPCQLVQYYRVTQTADLFLIFRNSPVYWDEFIAFPLPHLTSWLVKLVESDRERGLAEILFVAAKRPFQRSAAQRALIIVALRELKQFDSLEKLATAGRVLRFVPVDAEYLPRGFAGVQRRLGTIAQTVQEYLTRFTPASRMDILRELRDELIELRLMASVIGLPIGSSLQPLVNRWLRLVEQEQTECQKHLISTPLPNPFVAGNPLQPRDHELFKGRRDIVTAIEEHIINPDRSTTLLLYGRRRIGKTSTLLNLPRLLSSQFVPVFIDFQDAKWRESDAVFCYQLTHSLVEELLEQNASFGLNEPQLEQFELHPFTALDEALDRVEKIAQQLEKSILLTFDEYERLEGGLKTDRLTTAILDQLRHIVQHREGITVLFSGSHRFEELHGIAWSDYLINVKTLELSFLPEQDARDLLTEPVPELVYHPGAIERVLALTHCQPYLLQAVAFELVNSLNSQNRLEAQVEDIEAAAEKVLVGAQAYFDYTWREECSEEEKAVLRALAANGATHLSVSQDPKAVRSLCHKDILEKVGQQHRFTIELFRRWIVNNQNIGQSVRQSA